MKNLLTFATILACATAASAKEPVVVEASAKPTERVSFADLNLASTSGVHTMKTRIRTAADRICRSNNVEALNVKLASKSCYRGAVDGGYAQLERIMAGRATATEIAAATLTVGAK